METAEVIQSIAQFIPMMFFSALAFWRNNPVLFMLAAATSLFSGLYWFDQYVTPQGLAIGLSLIVYCFCCLGFAFRYIFWRDID